MNVQSKATIAEFDVANKNRSFSLAPQLCFPGISKLITIIWLRIIHWPTCHKLFVRRCLSGEAARASDFDDPEARKVADFIDDRSGRLITDCLCEQSNLMILSDLQSVKTG